MPNDETMPLPVVKIPPKGPPKDPKQAREFLREQTKTETEQRPYLDTEGGE